MPGSASMRPSRPKGIVWETRSRCREPSGTASAADEMSPARLAGPTAAWARRAVSAVSHRWTCPVFAVSNRWIAAVSTVCHRRFGVVGGSHADLCPFEPMVYQHFW